jgi:hypothetical protein
LALSRGCSLETKDASSQIAKLGLTASVPALVKMLSFGERGAVKAA